MREPGRRPLSPDDWARAALAAIARGGVGAVAVETVAAELGATKGSFYWHFKNRDALIQAALDRWEHGRTDAVIEKPEREPDPATRLNKLLAAPSSEGPPTAPRSLCWPTPIIRRRCARCAGVAERRIAERRIAYISQQLRALGWDPRGRARPRPAHVLRVRRLSSDDVRGTPRDQQRRPTTAR